MSASEADARTPVTADAPAGPFRIDAGGDPSASPLAIEAAAVRAERDGFDGVLSVELKHDPFISLALAARATERVRLTSSIAVAFARNPANTAMLANDLQLISDGRFVLGLGTQVKAHIERRFSMPWSHPARRMREYVEAVRAIWASWETGERLNFRGEFYNHTLMSPMFSPGPNPHGNPPIVLAAVGELMAETAGAVADGMLAHTFTTRRYLDEVTLPALARGRAASGRTDPVEISLPAFVALGTTDAELATAQTAVKKQIAFYGSTPTYKPVLELHGWESVHEQLHRASLTGEWDAMGGLITDEMLDAFAVSGTPAEVAAGLRERFGGVVSRLSFSAPYAVPDEVWAEVLAALRA
ncbi:MAG: TIGR03617 family F420-dependent LLM class oxidoreductase [Herbiconiux sp.]|uniref:TIGR03617 family F420-dependent LLM class oxidoreductase n=1 Tax=Herbiconiux sp. TaxID=1871186 RepID=UPI00120589A3|nr:TIGR03617 family F420-dependent LLM class oxidoreductase [Herbiconiux sp.]TAJ48235.1 MAG: TIGR03617 family F420-dependent LLM class oxidoreductase [Herbiconiux sp.]